MSLFKQVYTELLEVRNPLVLVHAESDTSGGADDTHDIGYFGQYWDGTNVVYTGLFRDADDGGKFKLFDTLQELPDVDTGAVNTAGTGYTLADLDVNNLVVAGDLTVEGTTTTINTTTLNVEDNFIVANSGPANQKEDAGFIVRRTLSNVILDTPKETSLVIDDVTTGGAVTTTEINLRTGEHTDAQAIADYYVGWAINVTGTGAGSSFITASTATDPVRLTLETALGAAPVVSDSYELFNRKYVGTIYDESVDEIRFYGFPREDTESVISPSGNGGNGNLADLLNVSAQDLDVDGNLLVTGATSLTGDITTTGNLDVGGDLSITGDITGPISATDNIFPINSAGTSNDGGFVICRSNTNMISDVAEEAGTIQTNGTNSTSFTLSSLLSGVGTTDYYKGWTIQFTSGTATGSAEIFTSGSAGEIAITTGSGITGTPQAGDTFNLYNKRYVGVIYDESLDKINLYGFAREDGEDIIDPLAVNGNHAEYLDFAANTVDVNNNLNVTNDTIIGGDLTVTGSIIGTLTANDNIWQVNSGVDADDGGFVFHRTDASIVQDNPEESGVIVGGAHTHTNTTFGASGGVVDAVGVVDDYYNFWAVKFRSDTTTAALQGQFYEISDYVATNKVFTTSTSMAATPQAGDVFDLYHLRHVGLIWDQDVQKLNLYGFAREIGVTDIDINDPNGNFASYMDLCLKSLDVKGDLIVDGSTTLTGPINLDGDLLIPDNILPVNTNGTDPDGGFVVCRSGSNVVASDTAEEAGIVAGGAHVHTTTTIGGDGATAATGAVDDYYIGWYLQFDPATTTALLQGQVYEISDYVAVNKVFTTSTTMAAIPVDGDTFNLFNKRYVGMIYDESEDKICMYGFPREDNEAIISPTATDGNQAEYMDFCANSIDAQNTITATNNITSTSGDIETTAGAINSGSTITAATGITSTNGDIVATAGAVNAGTTVTAGTGLNVTTGDVVVSSGNVDITGNLSLSGVIEGPVQIDDNIFAINTGPTNQAEDGGFVVCRTLAQVIADTAKESGTLTAAGTTTTITLPSGFNTDAEANANYYTGWAIEITNGSGGSSFITSSTAAVPVVLTLETSITAPAGTETFEMYNKKYVGPIYDDSTNQWTLYGFPRESGETTISTISTAGNVADYIDLSVNNISVNGSISVEGGVLKKTITQVGTTTFNAAQIKENDIIYLNPSSNTTYTLPEISTLGLGVDEATCATFVNINASNTATISADASETIEGDLSFNLKRQWVKFTLIASSAHDSTWIIE